MFDAQTTLGQLASLGPAARSALLKHQIDFCCRGNRSLQDAVAEDGKDLQMVMKDLKDAVGRRNDETNWHEEPLEKIVNHVIEFYHNPLPSHLETVIRAAERVEVVHGSKPDCPHGLAEHLRTIEAEVLEHIQEEEGVVFPAIIEGQGKALDASVTQLMAEHTSHGEALIRTRELAHDLNPPPGACNTWRTLYEELVRFEAELMDHIHLENNILFPRALAQG